jgi:DNA-binding XRE family transcriptional regulator
MAIAPSTPHDRTPEAVGYRLRILRAALDDIAAKDVCAAINVATNTYSQWEKGRSLPDLLAMTRLWDHFGADLNYIYLGRTDTLPFELAMKIREKLAIGSVGTDAGDGDDAPVKLRTKKERARSGRELSSTKVHGE